MPSPAESAQKSAQKSGVAKRVVRAAAWLALAGGGLTALAGLAAPVVIARDAVLAQRVRVDETAAGLFGDAEPTLVPIGSPQIYIVSDRSTLLERTGPDGLRYLDEARLQRDGRYPLQAKTVEFLGRTAAQAGGAAILLGSVALVATRRRKAGRPVRRRDGPR